MEWLAFPYMNVVSTVFEYAKTFFSRIRRRMTAAIATSRCSLSNSDPTCWKTAERPLISAASLPGNYAQHGDDQTDADTFERGAGQSQNHYGWKEPKLSP